MKKIERIIWGEKKTDKNGREYQPCRIKFEGVDEEHTKLVYDRTSGVYTWRAGMDVDVELSQNGIFRNWNFPKQARQNYGNEHVETSAAAIPQKTSAFYVDRRGTPTQSAAIPETISIIMAEFNKINERLDYIIEIINRKENI